MTAFLVFGLAPAARADDPEAKATDEPPAQAAGFAFGAPVGSTNPKLDEMYAAAGLFSGSNEDMIAKMAKLPLEAQPGTLFRYGLQQEFQGVIIQRYPVRRWTPSSNGASWGRWA